MLLLQYRNMNDKHQRFIIKMAGELEEMDAPVQVHAPRIRLLSLPYAEDAVAAGVGADGFEANCRQCYVHDTPQLREADILFHVNGDSMEPTYPDGCTVMVQKSNDVDTGDIGIFSVDGTLFIKECQPDGLHSINPKYPPMLSKKFGEIRIIMFITHIFESKNGRNLEQIMLTKSSNQFIGVSNSEHMKTIIVPIFTTILSFMFSPLSIRQESSQCGFDPAMSV